jgi:hypothetical protein
MDSLLLRTFLNGIVSHLEILHHHLLSFITPIDIADALPTIVKVRHMPGPVLAQHPIFPTWAQVANGDFFLNRLFPLLSLGSHLLCWLLLVIIARVMFIAIHVYLSLILYMLNRTYYIMPIKVSKTPPGLPKCLLTCHITSCQSTS